MSVLQDGDGDDCFNSKQILRHSEVSLRHLVSSFFLKPSQFCSHLVISCPKKYSLLQWYTNQLFGQKHLISRLTAQYYIKSITVEHVFCWHGLLQSSHKEICGRTKSQKTTTATVHVLAVIRRGAGAGKPAQGMKQGGDYWNRLKIGYSEWIRGRIGSIGAVIYLLDLDMGVSWYFIWTV